MPEIFINGQAIQARDGQTVMEVAREHGHFIPYFCWHPRLSIAGNCRMCLVEVEGRGLDIACNMPVSKGMKVFTASDEVKAHRKAILQFITLNHPVDCGICDKAGECTLQDYHYEYNGERSLSRDEKVKSTKFYNLSNRILLDNERCILCLRCTRFTHEVSKSMALGIERRGDVSNIRPVEDRPLSEDPYSDNIVDLCPVGALLSRQFLHKSRVWFLQPTPSVCPRCARGCSIQVWHRKQEWHLKALDPRQNESIARVTPLENPAVNGPWICNVGRDLAQVFERARAEEPMLKGRPVGIAAALDEARRIISTARHCVALVSNWGSNEELEAFKRDLGEVFHAFVKQDWQPQPGERIEDDLLIRADKNPNSWAARELFGDAAPHFPEGTDVVLVWGEGFDFAQIPPRAKVIFLNSYLQPENGHADVFLPVSIQTERSGHYTNFQGVVSAFEPCFEKKPGVSDAEALFKALAAPARGHL
ncbi:MAG TPA: 2Fe-2S iron-sulfur cluster-binding protein [Steroidobacteraceae bacterium]|nr:2Fe-2S iron-sulfur cluster-binding protein [Steroidobacteraceae bacterium]